MIEYIRNHKLFRSLVNNSSQFFALISVAIIIMSFFTWYFEMKPRLINEVTSNMRILAASRVQSIETRFQNLSQDSDITVIRNSINELLLITDPDSGEKLFTGIELEIDFDALIEGPNISNFKVGNTNCKQCIKTENPIFKRSRGELIGIIYIYTNPIFYQRLVADIGVQLTFVMFYAILIMLIATILLNRLFRKLKEREKSLTTEISERKIAQKRLAKIATYDQLTNLPNRYLLNAEFSQKILEAQRHGKKLAVLFFDLDNFKSINDVYGHETGDILLVEVSKRILGLVRRYDLLARFGGDEFVMILSHLNDPNEILPVAQKIIDSFSDDYDVGQIKMQVTTSIGISVYPEDGKDSTSLMKNADLAMYRAKSEGKNRYQFFTAKLNRDLERAQWLETNLKEAIRQDILELFFQPQIDLKSGKMLSCEALIRWPQVDGSFIEPSEFIPISERTGLINRLSELVFNKVSQHQRNWNKAGYEDIRIDINVSSKDFSNKVLIDQLVEQITRAKQLGQHIGIEITENILMKSNQQVLDILTQLHEAKVHISIDDFGTGYSSLNYLKHFPVSCLKIDRSFVREAPRSAADLAIMQAIISVAHGLGMTVTAEGVESREILNLSESLGCDAVQGYVISEPLCEARFVEQFLNPAKQ